MRKFNDWTIAFLGLMVFAPLSIAQAADFIIYGMNRDLDMGNVGEAVLKDYYVNMGSAQGLKSGTALEVVRRMPTYDLTSQKLYKDVSFPIARLKIIHVERDAAIARLDKMIPSDQTPVIVPRAVMVGDVVRVAE